MFKIIFDTLQRNTGAKQERGDGDKSFSKFRDVLLVRVHCSIGDHVVDHNLWSTLPPSPPQYGGRRRQVKIPPLTLLLHNISRPLLSQNPQSFKAFKFSSLAAEYPLESRGYSAAIQWPSLHKSRVLTRFRSASESALVRILENSSATLFNNSQDKYIEWYGYL